MGKLKEFRFSLGNSNRGPVGFCAIVKAKDEADALDLLKRTLPSELAIPASSDKEEDNKRVVYIRAYFNSDAIGIEEVGQWS